MKARIIRVGNSRGIRLPKPLLDHAGRLDEVERERLVQRQGALSDATSAAVLSQLGALFAP